MPLWRCPHCGTPQAESSRCWVCRRSTTSCATCREFRRGVASGLGLCGLAPRRVALDGTEMRACWAAPDPGEEVSPVRVSAASLVTAASRVDRGGRNSRTFVPVDEIGRPGREPVRAAPPPPARRVMPRGAWCLWGEPER